MSTKGNEGHAMNEAKMTMGEMCIQNELECFDNLKRHVGDVLRSSFDREARLRAENHRLGEENRALRKQLETLLAAGDRLRAAVESGVRDGMNAEAQR